MATPSAKSNPRTSELNDPMRRSFTGNPFAKPSLVPDPTHGSSDFPRRNSFCGRDGSFIHNLDDKENGNDQILKPLKARSPSISSKTTTRNFMSPTISAASKVTMSPRKKVLAERNEPSRSSAPSTITDPKSPNIRKVTFAEPLCYSDVKQECGGVEQKKVEALLSVDDGVPKDELDVISSLSYDWLCGEPVHDMNLDFNSNDETVSTFEAVADEPFNPKNETVTSSFETITDEPDCVNLDPTFKLSPTLLPPTTPPVSSSSTLLAPLDADPLMPPYDPKTNYLSPRPQFLHYKPKPQIGMELLEDDSFLFGSFSDTEVTEDTQSEVSQRESEDVSSDETIEGEPSPADGNVIMAEESVESKEVPKPRFFMRSKAIIALLMLLSVAFASISVTNSPVIVDHNVFQDFYKVCKLSEYSDAAKAHFDRISEFAKANFGGLARNFKTSFTKSLSSISELISNEKGVHRFGHLQYGNLTVLREYDAVDQGPIFGLGRKEIIVEAPEVQQILEVEDSNADSVIDTHEGIRDISVELYDLENEEQVQEDEESIVAVEEEVAPESEEVLEGQPATEIDTNQALQMDEVSEQVQEDEELIVAVEEEVAPESEELLEGQPAKEIDPNQPLQMDEVSEQVQEDMVAIAAVENASEDDGPDSEELLEGQPAKEIDPKQTLHMTEVESSLDAEAVDIHMEVFKAENIEAKQAQEQDHANLNVEAENVEAKQAQEDHHANINVEVAEVHIDDLKFSEEDGESISIDAATEDNEQRMETVDHHLQQGVVLYLLIGGATVLIAGTAFNLSRKKGKVEQPLLDKAVQANNSLQKSPMEEQSYHHLEKQTLRNWPLEIDMQGESCPSEMSSFRRESSSYYRQKAVKEFTEVHSQERKPKKRRESMASSDCSMGSTSYGSFTTYEKIPIKKGDEEIVTPVRRSSRIRSHVNSPL